MNYIKNNLRLCELRLYFQFHQIQSFYNIKFKRIMVKGKEETESLYLSTLHSVYFSQYLECLGYCSVNQSERPRDVTETMEV